MRILKQVCLSPVFYRTTSESPLKRTVTMPNLRHWHYCVSVLASICFPYHVPLNLSLDWWCHPVIWECSIQLRLLCMKPAPVQVTEITMCRQPSRSQGEQNLHFLCVKTYTFYRGYCCWLLSLGHVPLLSPMGSGRVATATDDKPFPLHEVPRTAVPHSQPLRGASSSVHHCRSTHCFSNRD